MKRIIILIPFCLLLFEVHAQKTLTDSIRGIQQDMRLDARKKIAMMTATMGSDQVGMEEKLDIYHRIVIPEIRKIKPAEAYDEEMARAYRHMASLYYHTWDVAAVRSSLDTAIMHVEKTRNDTLRGAIYHRYAKWHIQSGSLETAHRYLYKAIDIYDKLGDKDEISGCFFLIASSYAQMRDHEGMRSVISGLTAYKDDGVSRTFLHDLYQIQGAYYHLLYEAFPENDTYRDSTVLYLKKCLFLGENHTEQLSHRIDYAWDYFNLTVAYLNDFDPPLLDSVSYYLEKMKGMDFSGEDENDRRELLISIYDTEAWLHYYRGEYDGAEKKILEALDLLGQQTDPNLVIPEYSVVYEFLAMLYEETGRNALALKYQKLFNENQSERFKQEKMYALKELNTKYEVEKKEAHIEELKREKEYTHRIFLLTLVVSAALTVAVILLVAALRLRRKSTEQKLYEMALVAEQRQEDLEHKKEHRTKQKDSAIITGKVRKIIESSGLGTTAKQKYLGQLAELDTAKLEETLVSEPELTPMDMKYIVCFSIGMDVQDISAIFNIEPASVYTVRYRIKKKFTNNAPLDFLA